MDFLFMILGFIPTAIAVIWFFGSHADEKSPAKVDTIGSIALGIFGLTLTGMLRSFANNEASAFHIASCCICFIITAICIYINNKKNKE